MNNCIRQSGHVNGPLVAAGVPPSEFTGHPKYRDRKQGELRELQPLHAFKWELSSPQNGPRIIKVTSYFHWFKSSLC